MGSGWFASRPAPAVGAGEGVEGVVQLFVGGLELGIQLVPAFPLVLALFDDALDMRFDLQLADGDDAQASQYRHD